MHKKYQEHLKLAEELGVKNIGVLKKAFRNLEKAERADAKKNGYDRLFPSFDCYVEEEGDEPIIHIYNDYFFRVKGSNGGERRDAIINYIVAAGTRCNTIEYNYGDLSIGINSTSIKMKKKRSKKWKNGKK